MKHLLLPLAFSAIAAISASSQDAPPYIIPVDADGEINTDGKIAMTLVSDGIYELKNYTIDNGFFFYGEKGGIINQSTYYTLTSFAVNPPVENHLNPISITQPSSTNYIKVAPAVYDITFSSRDNFGSSYHMFEITPVDREAAYPQSLFLVWGNKADQHIEITGSDGFYETTVPSDQTFKISYEPIYDISQFLIGPTTAPSSVYQLESGVKIPIQFGEGTDVSFIYYPSKSSDSSAPHTLTISLVPDNQYIVVDKQETTFGDSIFDDADTTQTVYSLNGTIVKSGHSDLTSSLPTGMYLIRRGNTVTKEAVR